MAEEKTTPPPFEFQPANRISTFGQTVWHEFSPLAQKYGACNLGQGFPNFVPPKFVVDAAIDALTCSQREHQAEIAAALSTTPPPPATAVGGDTLNQYARASGHGRLVQALAKRYSPILGRTIEPLTEILVTNGASEGLYVTINALAGPGDEVVLIAPFFDIYYGAVILSGATPRVVPLRPADSAKFGTGAAQELSSSELVIRREDIIKAVNEKTKLFIINSPHNPSGKVFSAEELSTIVDAVRERAPHCVFVSDEVYENILFDGRRHIPLVSAVPDAWQRTVTLSSAGKTFSITGWKVGWAIGPAPLIGAVARVHQFVPFAVNTPLQDAIGATFENTDALDRYYPWLTEMYSKKRTKLVTALQAAGLRAVVPQGSFFVLADISAIRLQGNEGREKTITGQNLDSPDWNVCRWLTTDIGVAAIPCSAFTEKDTESHAFYSNFARFCFCKSDDLLDTAAERLLKVRARLSS